MAPSNNTIWVSAGEVSGDVHGAWLLHALRERDPSLRFIGMGGRRMMLEKGFTPLFYIDELSLLGITEVIRFLPKIFNLLSRTKEALAEHRPRALVVIDAPSFHFRVIKAAKRLGIPVYYYISPKVWAWKEWRALFIKKNVRRLISILPFEEAFYKRFGMKIDYVGNPLVDMVDWERIRHISPESGKIGLLPGSRKKEISSLTPEFGKAARILLRKLPHLTFHMVRAPGIEEAALRAFWPTDVPLNILPPDDRYAFMRSCEMIIAASGTVTLEAALCETPTLVTYKTSAISYALAKLLVTIPHISLANLILNKPLLPELLQQACDGPPLAEKALEWLLPPKRKYPLKAIRRSLSTLRARLGEPGAVNRAAGIILDDLAKLPVDHKPF